MDINCGNTKSHDIDITFQKLIPDQRPPKSVHPVSTNSFPKSKKKIITKNIDKILSYSEFAWEFLRRNRFYQAMVDGRDTSPVTEWGYRWSDQVARTHGLARIKPYWDQFDEEAPPAWTGLESFAERLPISTSLETKSVHIQLQSGQVAVVFDVAGIIGGQSPWDVQVWATRERLAELCKRDFQTSEIKGKPSHKKILMKKLKMFDLLSDGKTSIDIAASRLNYRRKKSQSKYTANQIPMHN